MTGMLKPSKWFGFPILYLQFIITGLLGPTLPDIIVPFFNGSYSQAALVQGTVDSVGAFAAFCLSPVLGALSDRFGRRPFLLLVVFVTSLQVWAIALYPSISLWYYFVAKALGKISVYGPVLTYLADCTSLHDRSAAFGQATAAIFLALTSGPLICMVTTPYESFLVACLATVVNCSYIAFVLPETLTPEVRHRRKLALIRRKQRALSYSEATLRPRRLSPRYLQQASSNNSNSAPAPQHHHVHKIDVLPAAAASQHCGIERETGRERSLSDPPSSPALRFLPPSALQQLQLQQQQQWQHSNSSSRPGNASAAVVPGVMSALPPVRTIGNSIGNPPPLSLPSSASSSRSTYSQQVYQTEEGRHKTIGNGRITAVAAAQQQQQEEREQQKREKKKKGFNPFRTLSFIGKNRLYQLIIALVFFSQLSEYGIFETEPLYLKQKLDFTRDDRSHVMVVNGVCTFLVLTVLMPRLLQYLREPHVIMLALLCEGTQLCMYTLISEKWQAYLTSIIASFAPMCYPAASSLLSQHVSPNDQGLAQGALSGFKSLTQGFGPLLFSVVYSFFNALQPPYQLPEATFGMGALFVLIAVILTLRVPAASWKRKTASSSSSTAPAPAGEISSKSPKSPGRRYSQPAPVAKRKEAAVALSETAPLLEKGGSPSAGGTAADQEDFEHDPSSNIPIPSAASLDVVLPDAVPSTPPPAGADVLLSSAVAAAVEEEEEEGEEEGDQQTGEKRPGSALLEEIRVEAGAGR